MAAGAFIARHCIFNDVAADRPDTDDMRKIDNFATECARLLASTPDVSALPEPTVKGNRPYKESKALPLFPSADAELCDGCQTCARQCPQARYRKSRHAKPTATSAYPADGVR